MIIPVEYRETMERLIEQTVTFPKPHNNLAYWHLPMPASSALFNPESISSEVQRALAQLLIDRAYHLAEKAPEHQEKVRVVAAIVPANLWDSQIIVFFGPDYFNTFFDRNSKTQFWSNLEDKSLVQDWNLKCPKIFSEHGYDEAIEDEDGNINRQLWFIGQLK